jgi:hypothetical protein
MQPQDVQPESAMTAHGGGPRWRQRHVRQLTLPTSTAGHGRHLMADGEHAGQHGDAQLRTHIRTRMSNHTASSTHMSLGDFTWPFGASYLQGWYHDGLAFSSS